MSSDHPMIRLQAMLQRLTTVPTPEPSERFLGARNDTERLAIVERTFVRRHLRDCNGMSPLCFKKCNTKADTFRTEGNAPHNAGKLNLSLLYYNGSIAAAEPGSVSLAEAYGVRADALYNLGLYEKSLESIQLAKAARCPGRLLEKLNRREELCLDRIEEENPRRGVIFELSYEPHPTIPFIANCLFLWAGRGIRTNRNLKVGDVVAIEEPFVGIQYFDYRSSRCWHCLRYSITMLPCPKCTTIMFCNTECRDQASTTYHEYECPAIDLIVKLESQVLFSMRMFLTALKLFDSVAEFKSFCEDPENQKDNIFESSRIAIHSKEYLKLVLGAEPTVLDNTALYKAMTAAALAKRILLCYTTAKDKFRTKLEEQFLVEQMVKFAKIQHAKQYRTDQPTFGLRTYGFSKYLRHSCDPNVVRVCAGLKSYIFVLRPISIDEELCENYWHSREFEDWVSVSNWKTISIRQFNFVCTCDRCEFDRPKEFYRVASNSVPMGRILKHFNRISTFTEKFAERNYKAFCLFIETYRDYPNCLQIKYTQACLIVLWDLLTQAITMPVYKNSSLQPSC